MVLFAAGIAAAFLIIATVRSGFKPDFEIWLACGLVCSLILHARASFALSKAQQEIELLSSLVRKFNPKDKSAPKLKFDSVNKGQPEDADALRAVQSAIENDRVDLYLQPIVSLPQRKLRYFEAFSRLRQEDGRFLQPNDYLDAAERANRIGLIDNMILLRAVQALRQLGAAGAQYRIFCNISPATIFDQDFFVRFTDYLDANEDFAHQIIFEFTYPAVEMMHERVKSNMRAVADRGFSFSVDHIRRFDLNWRALGERGFRYVKASSAMLLAESAKGSVGEGRIQSFKQNLHDNNIDLIVEKVELESQLPGILALGIDYGQGNLFGAPKPAQGYLGPKDDFALAS
ncbi:EAL domain-containing protein [Hyphococcus flavus]|uniref:EAL domain-containing protein n=1 Tax=Hyphococcus flavus TaxID=1866326 RepID=A0AAE9ZCW2_9PROT|nr:EAL domain-containing protein [Hyphococcus flavus]WDI32559.1 EAL domain-containing protein [Hyphococcus flavus]